MKKPELTEYQKEVLAVVLDMTDQGKKSVKVEDVIKEMQRREGLPNQAFKAFCSKCKTVHTTATCPNTKEKEGIS